jgi:hypothetical protein
VTGAVVYLVLVGLIARSAHVLEWLGHWSDRKPTADADADVAVGR